MPFRLLDLPEEVVEHVCEDLGQCWLVRTVLTCRCLGRIARAALYRHPNIKGSKAWHAFTATLRSAPETGHLVRSVAWADACIYALRTGHTGCDAGRHHLFRLPDSTLFEPDECVRLPACRQLALDFVCAGATYIPWLGGVCAHAAAVMPALRSLTARGLMAVGSVTTRPSTLDTIEVQLRHRETRSIAFQEFCVTAAGWLRALTLSVDRLTEIEVSALPVLRDSLHALSLDVRIVPIIDSGNWTTSLADTFPCLEELQVHLWPREAFILSRPYPVLKRLEIGIKFTYDLAPPLCLTSFERALQDGTFPVLEDVWLYGDFNLDPALKAKIEVVETIAKGRKIGFRLDKMRRGHRARIDRWKRW